MSTTERYIEHSPELKYKMFDQQATYQQAKEICYNQGLQLPMPKTAAESLELKAAVTQPKEFFLGLTAKDTGGRYFT